MIQNPEIPILRFLLPDYLCLLSMTVLLVITLLFLGLYALLLAYYYRHWKDLPVYTPGSRAGYTSISVVVPARNEEKSLPLLLSALKKQSYPASYFEVIIVDDFSEDGTAVVAGTFGLSNLVVVRPEVKPDASSKKKAIAAGIARAKGQLIVTTDADCCPHPDWLFTLNHFYQQKGARFMAAPVRFRHDGSLLQLFQAMDFLMLQGITAASVHASFHTMCNGANLAYPKAAFYEVDGFAGIDRVASGDDMLLMYKIWKRSPGSVFYLKSKNAVVTTTPMRSWTAFWGQRRRWASKTLVYDDYRILAVLCFVYLFNLLFVVLLLAGLWHPGAWLLAALLWVGKAAAEWPLFRSVARFYEENKALRYFFLLQPLHIAYTVLVGLLSQFGRYEWKGRRVR